MDVRLSFPGLLVCCALVSAAHAEGPVAGASPAGDTQAGKPAAGAAAPARAPEAINSPAQAFAADRPRISYAIGIEMARNFRKNEVDVDLDEVMKGMKDGLAGNRPPMAEKELRKVLNNFQNVMRARTSANQHVLAQANRKKGEAFLAENRNQPGVKTLVNGVQYKELKAGTGLRPGGTDVIVVNWRGTTLDGTEYDSSEPGHPMKIAVADLFNGWRSVATLMQEGAHWQIWVPSALAYGERGVGADLGPNETVVLDVELQAVQPRNASTP